MRRPGIEPGSTAWKAAMLTTIPPTHSTNFSINKLSIKVGYTRAICFEKKKKSNVNCQRKRACVGPDSFGSL